jgi:enhancing lycopene biosynthesis protein 2
MVDADRNVMVEAARIARGAIKPLDSLKATDFDAIIFVGGFGAAKNLSSYAFDGPDYDADPMVIDLIQTAHTEGKALGFMCIAPVLAARALGDKGVRLTIGNDPAAAAALEAKGATHVDCAVEDALTDTANKVVTTPAYMLAETIGQAESGIQKLVKSVLKLA